jgi:hypothetical protein
MLFRVSLKRDPVPILVEDRVHVRAKSQLNHTAIVWKMIWREDSRGI